MDSENFSPMVCSLGLKAGPTHPLDITGTGPNRFVPRAHDTFRDPQKCFNLFFKLGEKNEL